MTPPPHAAFRRPARSGAAHLALVTDQDELVAPADDEQPQTGRHAAPSPGITGSATIRALMALGALLTTVGLTAGKADAVLRAHQGPPTADPVIDPIPETTAPDNLHSAASAVPAGGSAAVKATAASWAPAARPATVAFFKMPDATGRHRKPLVSEERTERSTGTWESGEGRHRRQERPHVPQGRKAPVRPQTAPRSEYGCGPTGTVEAAVAMPGTALAIAPTHYDLKINLT